MLYPRLEQGFGVNAKIGVCPPRFLTVHPLGASATFVRLWKWQQRFMETARGNGKCSKINQKTVCHALDTIQ